MDDMLKMRDPAARRAPVSSDSTWLKALPPASRLAFFGGVDAQTAALPVWGVAFPEQACRAHRIAGRATLWLGPDEYLLLDMASTSTPLDSLESALADIPHAVVDISHRQFALEMRGPHAAAILNGACPLDLDLTTFPIGMCTRTVLAKADIVLWRTEAAAFHLEVWRSFAGYVTGVLAEIASEYH